MIYTHFIINKTDKILYLYYIRHVKNAKDITIFIKKKTISNNKLIKQTLKLNETIVVSSVNDRNKILKHFMKKTELSGNIYRIKHIKPAIGHIRNKIKFTAERDYNKYRYNSVNSKNGIIFVINGG